MRVILWLNTFMLANGLVMAQNSFNYYGRLLNALTMNPVESALIIYIPSDSSNSACSISDSNGFFQFKDLPEIKAKILIKHLNYCDTSITLNELSDNKQNVILLLPKEYALEEVTIKGRQTLVRNSLSKLEFIVTDNIKNESAQTLDVIGRIPVVYVDFNNNIWINGSSKVLVQINGIDLPNSNMANQISPEKIKKIEVITTLPTKYVNKDYTAILNIIAERSRVIGGSINGKFSPQNNIYDVSPEFNYTKNRQSIYAMYNLYYRNFEELNIFSKSNDSSFSKLSLSTFPHQQLDNEFYYGYIYEGKKNIISGFNGYNSFYRENFKSQFRDILDSDYNKFHERFNTNNIETYLKNQDSIFSFDAKLTWNVKSLHDHNHVIYEQNNEENNSEMRKIGGEFDGTKHIKNLVSAFGIEYSNLKASEKYENSFQEKIIQNYYENRLTFYFDLKREYQSRGFSLGMNLFYYKRKFQENALNVEAIYLSPVLSYIEKFNSKNTIKFSVSSNIQNPSLWQMISIPVTINPKVYYKGNPYLKPCITRNIELSYSYSHEHTYIEITPYARFLDNSIQKDHIHQDTGTFILSNLNIDRTYQFGILQNINFTVTSWWKIKALSEIFWKRIPMNESFYNNQQFSWNVSVSSYFNISSKLFAGVRYIHYSSQLIYKGIYQPYNSSLATIRYKISENIDLSMIALQPICKYKTRFMMNGEYFQIQQENQLNIRSFIISLNLRLSKNKNPKPTNLFYNEDKKY